MIRSPAVAGTFYPADPKELAETVDRLLETAASSFEVAPERRLVGLIGPHAGYRYSGFVAAAAHRLLIGRHYRRVVLLAPSHQIAFRGLAIPDCDAFSTPLGLVPLWDGCRVIARRAPFVLDSRPHAREHAIEVHLPFLQRVLGEFELVPIVFGHSDSTIDPTPLVELLEPGTLVVVSTDLSHYLPYDDAKCIDEQTLAFMVARDYERTATADACGRGPTATFLWLATQMDWDLHLLDYKTSGDSGGDKTRVVGYAALAAVAALESLPNRSTLGA